MKKLVIFRNKGQSEVNAEVELWNDDVSIGLRLGLEQFEMLLADEIGNPTMIITKEQLRKRIKEASEALQKRLKQETKKVV